MHYNKVEICGVNTSQLKTLTDEEKRDLLKKTKEGDEDARRSLVHGNLRLVLSVIQRFSARHDDMDDLFQVGCIGLIKAIDNFNIELDVKFSTYAVPMIIGEIRRYLRDNNAIRISRSVRDTAYRALQAREALASTSSKDPTIEEIVKCLNKDGASYTKEEVAALAEHIGKCPHLVFDGVQAYAGHISHMVSLEERASETKENTEKIKADMHFERICL